MATICKNANHQIVNTFHNEYRNVYSVPKPIKSDKGGALISKDYNKFYRSRIIDRVYGTANLHTGTGLVERTIQSVKNLTLANVEDSLNLRESINRAFLVLWFTIHSQTKKSLFEANSRRARSTELSNLKIAISEDSKDSQYSFPGISAVKFTDHLVMSKKKTVEPKFRRRKTFSQTKQPTSSVSMNKYSYPFKFYKKN